MSLSVNNAADVVSEIVKFVGIGELKVQTVNPTKSEIKALFNRDVEKEPVYWDAATNQRKLVFFYECKGFVTDDQGKIVEKTVYGTHTVWMKNEVQANKNKDKFVFIDNFGKHLYMDEATSKNIPSTWKIDQKTLRPAYTGEGDLVDFMKALCAPAQGQQFYIPNVANIIVNGDVSVLRNAINTANSHGNLVRALLGVRKNEGKSYQVLFNKWFDFKGTTKLDWLWKQLKENKDYLKNYFGTFDWNAQSPNADWFKLKVYKDGMENGSVAATTPPAVQSFANMFGAAQPSQAVSPNAAMASTPQPSFGPPNQAMSATMMPSSPDPILGGDDDDLPF